MAKGISLHIGLNKVDPGHYEGWDGELAACEYDANDMAALAAAQGFKKRTLLLTAKATVAALSNAMASAAKELVSGDLLLLTYSGHGGQVPDKNGDEADSMDETWVLFDRMLVDDELYAMWSSFKKGVRIVVLSDSCHSGSVIRFAPEFVSGVKVRRMPLRANEATYLQHKKTYDAVQKKLKSRVKAKVAAYVLLISGCQDDQYSMDGARNGKFTGTLRKTWNDGTFKGNYKKLHAQIVKQMPTSQRPNYARVGVRSAKFEGQQPFTIQ